VSETTRPAVVPGETARAAAERSRGGRAPSRLAELVAQIRAVLPPAPVEVVDAGGGTGQLAVLLAADGHQVTVIDPSVAMLATAAERAAELGPDVADRLRTVQGDAERAAELLGPGSADAVLCHGVLGVVSDQAAAVAALASLLRPGGTLSLVAANRVELVVRHARRGDYREALRLLDDPAVSTPRGRGSGQSSRAWTLDEIRPWCTGAGLEVVAEHGLRVFAEPPPGTDQAELDAARELERRAATREPYRSGSEYLHVLAVRPG